MRLESTISGNIRNFLILELKSSISWNTKFFSILEVESSISWNMRHSGWFFLIFFEHRLKSSLDSSITHYSPLSECFKISACGDISQKPHHYVKIILHSNEYHIKHKTDPDVINGHVKRITLLWTFIWSKLQTSANKQSCWNQLTIVHMCYNLWTNELNVV